MESRDGKTPVDLLIKNGFVITIDRDGNVFTNGFVAVHEKKILAVGPMTACAYAGKEEIDAKGGAVMPGLVNSHAHLVQTSIKGMGEGTEFMERFLGFYLPMTGPQDERSSYENVRMTLLEYVKGGITTTADDQFTNIHKDSIEGVIRAINEGGMRGHITRLSNTNPEVVPPEYREEIADGLRETERLQKRYNSDSIRIGAGTIGIGYVNTERELMELKEFSDATNSTLDIHAASSRDLAMLPARGWTDDAYSYLDQIGFWSKHTLMAHSQNIKPPQLERMRELGVRVTLCPTRSYPRDFTPFLKYHIKWGLGLDGAVACIKQDMWNAMRGYINTQRMFDSMRSASWDWRPGVERPTYEADPEFYRFPKHTEAVQFGGPTFGTGEMALERGTLGSAQALGWDDKIGTLEVGKWADVIVIDPDYPALNPRGVLVTLLVHAGDPDMVDTVIIGGRVVVRHRRHQIWDEEEVIAKANEQQRWLATVAKAERFMHPRGSRWKYV